MSYRARLSFAFFMQALAALAVVVSALAGDLFLAVLNAAFGGYWSTELGRLLRIPPP